MFGVALVLEWAGHAVFCGRTHSPLPGMEDVSYSLLCAHLGVSNRAELHGVVAGSHHKQTEVNRTDDDVFCNAKTPVPYS